MSGVADAILAGGLPQSLAPAGPKTRSARMRGVRQGGATFLLGVLVVPLLGVLSLLIPFPEELIALAAIVFFLGGIVRAAFALIFESGDPAQPTLEDNVVGVAQKVFGKQPQAGALPPSQSIPADNYMPPRAANWRDTNDLDALSVTDSTTKLLNEKEIN